MYHDGIDGIDVSKGEWLVLGRDKYKLDEFEQHFQDNNIFYERVKKHNPLQDKFEAIDLYENKLTSNHPGEQHCSFLCQGPQVPIH